MLLHLPIAILAALSPIAVSDSVPQFDIVRECRFEGGSSAIFDRRNGRAFQTQDGTGSIRQRRSQNLHGRDNDRRFYELCRAIDLPGNGTRRPNFDQ